MPERGATDICVMSPLSPVDAVSLLFNSPDVELELAGGGLLRVHAILVEGERVTATAPRLSVTTARVLRVGDRLLFHGRFFADSISGEVRVASVRPATAPGQTVVGCRFLDIDDGSVAKIDRILNGGREPDSRSAGFDVSSLRDL